MGSTVLFFVFILFSGRSETSLLHERLRDASSTLLLTGSSCSSSLCEEEEQEEQLCSVF